ncbi:hypothetical protein KUCAC02_036967 [Chaenocephalus aceratus]|nr:hypothetical protein KUCAC02_036967 [Chaenocephalus aceratus]
MLESVFEKWPCPDSHPTIYQTRETALTKHNLVQHQPLPQRDTRNRDDAGKGGSSDSSPGWELPLMALTDEAETLDYNGVRTHVKK